MTFRKKPIRTECLGVWNSFGVSRPLTASDLPIPCTALFMHALVALSTKHQLQALPYLTVDGPSSFYKTKRGEMLRTIHMLYSCQPQAIRPLTADETDLIRLAAKIAMKKRTLENNGSLYVPWEVAAACGLVLTYNTTLGPPEAVDYENAGLLPYCEYSNMIQRSKEVRDIYFQQRTIRDEENENLLVSLEPYEHLALMGFDSDKNYTYHRVRSGRLVSAFEDPEEYDYDDEAYHNMDT
jgi:hypothetical protein